MSNLSARLRKLETMRSAAGLTGPEEAEADRIAKQQARALITAAFAGRKYEPAGAELAELQWAQSVWRRQWERQNPGKSYEAYQEEHRVEAERLIEAAFGQGAAREEARLKENAAWVERNRSVVAAAPQPEPPPAPPLPAALR